jgi:acyl-CoA dehydrogenase
MDAPGIEVRPIINLAGEHEFNQVFFDNVRVPKSRRLGPENEGWAVARHLLLYEHGTGLLRRAAETRWRVGWITELARREADGYGGSLLDNPDFARRLALLDIGVQASEFACTQVIASERAGEPPGSDAELLIIRSRELGQALSELAMEAIGYYAAPDQKEARKVRSEAPPIGPEHAVLPTAFFLAQRAATISSGTPEVHRNNLAKRLLGL